MRRSSLSGIQAFGNLLKSSQWRTLQNLSRCAGGSLGAAVSPRTDLPWPGWWFDEAGNLRDPEGNRYRPEDLRASWWARQAWAERAGQDSAEILYLKGVLQERIKANAPASWLIEIRRQTPSGIVLVETVRIVA